MEESRKVKGKYVALSRYVIVRTVEKIMSRSLYSIFTSDSTVLESSSG
jgi:hypothetical protein